tara:strand:- start:236 stop:481 length:246 start_codon:yes stop_codon:yes gene_type:complete
MTIDKSLKIARGSIQSRNVLTRVERLKQLEEEERWNKGDSPFGLPKVRVAKVSLKRKKKVKGDGKGGEDGAIAETAETSEE